MSRMISYLSQTSSIYVHKKEVRIGLNVFLRTACNNGQFLTIWRNRSFKKTLILSGKDEKFLTLFKINQPDFSMARFSIYASSHTFLPSG